MTLLANKIVRAGGFLSEDPANGALLGLDAGAVVRHLVAWDPTTHAGTIGYAASLQWTILTDTLTIGNGNATTWARIVGATNAIAHWTSSGAAANEKHWQALATATQMVFRTINDAENATTDWLRITRTGIGIASVLFPAGITLVQTSATAAAPVNVPNVTATTVLTLPATAYGVYRCYFNEVGGNSGHFASCDVNAGTGPTTFTAFSAVVGGDFTAVTVTNAGAVQVTQNSGGAKLVNGAFVRIM